MFRLITQKPTIMPSQNCIKAQLAEFIAANPFIKSFAIYPGITVQPAEMAEEFDDNGDRIIGFPEEQLGQVSIIDISDSGEFTAEYEGHTFPVEFFKISDTSQKYHPCIVADESANVIFDNTPNGNKSEQERSPYELIELYKSKPYELSADLSFFVGCPVKRDKSPIFSSDVITDFINSSKSPKYRCLFAIAYFTGSRISEVIALTVDDIKDGKINFSGANSKSRLARSVEICPDLKGFLDQHKIPEGCQYLFISSYAGRVNKPITYRAVESYLKVLAGKDPKFTGFTSFTLVKSKARHMHDNGDSDKAIARFVGMKSNRTKIIRSLYQD
jgi:integrase/recombinase XerD